MRAANDLPDDDDRVMEAARDYLTELEAGHLPDRKAHLDRHPELADKLAECFDGIELAHAAAAVLRPPIAPPIPEFPANPLGDFQILRELGHGGMGVVYEAVQLSLGRRVALKVLPFAASLDTKHLQRFKTEAHAAAQLHHTNIVPIYAVGSERGVHFYAMQLIDGQSLDVLIRALRGEDVSPPRAASLTAITTIKGQGDSTLAGSGSISASQRPGRGRDSFRKAALIAAQVAEALDYAHETGVVHRDIKPANLLLDARGTVWITDFGLAQVSADVNVTQTGDVVGTLRYMSPEQASGKRLEVDQRTDVYSLGATLYELLTLEPIFPGQDRLRLLHQILHDEPRPPRQINRAIPVELETIVLKAVAKLPDDRYATAGDLAADLHRFLEERPILARRPSLLERSRKWMRRHPSIVVASVLLLVFGFLGLSVSTAMIAREHALTRAAYDRERQRAEEAEKRFKQARQAVDLLVQVSDEELGDHPALHDIRRRLLETALDYYQDFLREQEQSANAQTDLMASQDRIRRLLDDLTTLQVAHRLSLVTDPGVQKELGLQTAQGKKLARLYEGFSQERFRQMRSMWTAAPEARRQKFVEFARKDEKLLGEILTPQQRARLGQIVLQLQGVRAFQEPQVIEALRLTPTQKNQIWSIVRSEPGGRDLMFGPPPGRDHGSRMRQRPSLPSVDRALALLTPDQVVRWQELIGKPFEQSFAFPDPRSRGRFGPK